MIPFLPLFFKYPDPLRPFKPGVRLCSIPMSFDDEYKRKPIQEARPFFPEKTRLEFQAVFRRLAASEEFCGLKTFRKQVHYARRFVDADESLEKDVPNTELAKFFDVAHSETIRAILNTPDVDYEYLGKPSILSDDNFKDIVGWVKQAALNQKPMTMNDVVAEVFRVKHKRVSVDALRMALKRRLTVKIITAIPTEACRLNVDDAQVQQFFQATEALMNNVPAAFVFNIDETGINRYANAKKKRVAVHAGFQGRQIRFPVERNTQHSTVVACIAADGTAINPLIIVKHRTTRDTVRLRCWGDDKVCFRHSESGYVTNDLFIGWLRDTFIPSVEERRRKTGNAEQRAYLLLDNCSSHTSNDIVDLCRDNNIELVYFVPNTTHIFQPLDLCFFSAFKARLRSTVLDQRVRDKQTKNLLQILTAWDNAKKIETIQASFEMAGYVYRLVGETLCVSFSRHAVRGIDLPQDEEDPIVPPVDRRRPIEN